jgi:hypothetical protein
VLWHSKRARSRVVYAVAVAKP